MPVRTARTPRLSAGVVVVRSGPTGWLFLLLRAYRNWDFPKGVVDPGEEPLAAARREVREETLINDLQFTWGEEYRETAPYSNNKVARYYLAETRTEEVSLPVSPELGRPEHNEARWVDLAGALSLSSPRVAPIVQWAAEKLG
jgi:8-oxo-dGTP pyrophosphatase MutT (NUDIX family)